MKVDWNRSGIRDILNGDEVVAFLLAWMEEAKVRAVAIAPERTGRYKSAFTVFADHKKKDRPRAVLHNAMWYAIIVEFGADDTPRYRTLGKAVSPELY